MGYSYATFKTALAGEMSVSETDADFVAQLPTFIDDAEQRIYRDLDLLASSVTVNGTLTANTRYFTLPTTGGIHFLVIDAINTLDNLGARHAAIPASREVIDYLWPYETAPSSSSVPKLMARIDDGRVLFGPAPGAAFTAEVIGTIRPDALSVSNTTTYLASYLSDLFFAAAMISASAFMRNFGSQSDNPQMAVSWESQYQARIVSAKAEELRKNFTSSVSAPPASVRV